MLLGNSGMDNGAQPASRPAAPLIPRTNTDEYLAAILSELREINAKIDRQAPSSTGAQVVDVQEPATTPRNKRR